MRHCNNKGRLNRNISHRKATLKNMANSLLTYQRIETTVAKAKALRSFVEPIITLAKKEKDPVAARRLAYKKLCDRKTVKVLFDDLAPLFKDVNGGYTRILSLGSRKGDGAKKAIIELTKRTISDEDLLKGPKQLTDKASVKDKAGKKLSQKAKKPSKKQRTDAKEGDEKAHASAPDIDKEKKEEHFAEDVKKDKAKKEQKKIFQKGLFKRFRRKSI